MKQIWQLIKRPTIIIELICVAIGVAVACCANSQGLAYALSSGGAASALVALLLDIQNSLASYNQERQIILHFDKMISPIIRRWVEMYIYISDKNRVQSSALANKVNNAKRCGVDLMPNSFNLDDIACYPPYAPKNTKKKKVCEPQCIFHLFPKSCPTIPHSQIYPENPTREPS